MQTREEEEAAAARSQERMKTMPWQNCNVKHMLC